MPSGLTISYVLRCRVLILQIPFTGRGCLADQTLWLMQGILPAHVDTTHPALRDGGSAVCLLEGGCLRRLRRVEIDTKQTHENFTPLAYELRLLISVAVSSVAELEVCCASTCLHHTTVLRA